MRQVIRLSRIMQAWRMCGAGHGVRSREVGGHGLSRSELFLAGRRVNGEEDTNESDEAKKTLRKGCSSTQVPRTKTLVSPSTPTLTLIASPNTQPRPVVIRQRRQRRASLHQARCTPYLSYNPGIMRGLCMWYWTSVRSGGCWIVRSARRPPP